MNRWFAPQLVFLSAFPRSKTPQKIFLAFGENSP
jgi:hypothetical protein